MLDSQYFCTIIYIEQIEHLLKQERKMKTISLTHTFKSTEYNHEIVVSNSGMHHYGSSASGATHCNGRSGMYVQRVQYGGNWKVPATAKLCKKCFG